MIFLTARTDFSLGESILDADELITSCVDAGAKVIGVTDTMSITGMINFTTKAKKAGIKPVIGCRLRISENVLWRKTKEDKKAPKEYYVNYFVLSEKGMSELFKILTLANSDERFYNTPKISFDDLYKSLSNVSSEDVAISISDTFSLLHYKDAENMLKKIIDALSASNVFIDLVPIKTPLFDTLNYKGIKLIEKLGIRSLTTRPILYKKGDAAAAVTMSAIIRNVGLFSMWSNVPAFDNLYPLSEAEMNNEISEAKSRLSSLYPSIDTDHFDGGVKNLSILADMVKYEWKKEQVSLPKMATDEFAEVVNQCKIGFRDRFSKEMFGHKPSLSELSTVYKERLSYELGVLKSLNFSGYFLLVQDVVKFAKNSGILVGPGRGSVGGSLVAYLMGITDCDPIRFGLLFERFINPDRIDLPDADLDFMSERRHEVVEYLVNKYGTENVSGVSNFMTLGPASSIRSVGKAFGLSENDYRCSKLAPTEHGAAIELKKAAEQVVEIGQFRDKFPEIWNVSLSLEGTMRAHGKHAAGIIVSGCPLVERGCVERRSGESVINWDKKIVEDMGLVKMDILGLSTLDLMELTLRYIKERHGKTIDLMDMPLDDGKVLDNFSKGLTNGVFQFESGGMRNLLKQLGKDGSITFDDITACTALYRPGPMESGMLDSYWKRKQGIENVEYDHPKLETVLKPTFGVFVYQEQVMEAARVLAGYSGADADKLRKIMGKKLPEEMKKERGKFVDGCVAHSKMSAEESGDLFDKIEGFAGYGFNKSHSVEYTLISYQSMWLKTNYPIEFMAAALSIMDSEKLPGLLKECSRIGIDVIYPDVNLSTDRFEVISNTSLCIPFSRVKGLTEKVSKVIMASREKDGPFTSRAEFEKRVRSQMVNIAKINNLDKIGAFSSIEPSTLPQKCPERIKDQRELIPGLVTDTVPIYRVLQNEKLAKLNLANVISKCFRDNSDDGANVKPTFGKEAKFMVVTDSPTKGEDEIGQMSYGKGFDWFQTSLCNNDMKRADAYWTSLLKRPKEGKQVSGDEIKTYAPVLMEEIKILKPPVIVLCGSTVVRQFIPDFKGKASDMAGKIFYHKELDTNLVIGFSPGEIWHDNSKQELLDEVFRVAKELTE